MGEKKKYVRRRVPTDEEIMRQIDVYQDEDILKQQNKRFEDIKGMRSCTLCTHCHLDNINSYFVDGKYKCRAFNIWRKISESFEYNCKYFSLRSCLYCYYYNSYLEPCSVAKDRLSHGIDMRYSNCSHFRMNNYDYKLKNALVIGRKYIPYDYRFDTVAMKNETIWLIEQVKSGNSKYKSARRYDKRIKDVMQNLYDRYEINFRNKATIAKLELYTLDKYLKEGYENISNGEE